MYIVKKLINGREYYYLNKSVRKGDKVISKNVAYLGKDKVEAEAKAEEIKAKMVNGGGGFKNKSLNVIIVHGSNESEKSAKEGESENLRHWKPWLKKSLEKYEIKISNDLYPNDWLPNYEEWKVVFEKNKINDNTILVGHSAGTAFILRWLAENKRHVDKVILVAPSTIKTDKYKNLSKLKDFKFDSSLKKYFNKIVVFYSDEDEKNIVDSAKNVHSILGGKLIQIDGMGHFVEGDMGKKEFPELLKEIVDGENIIEVEEFDETKKLSIEELAVFCKEKGFVYRSSDIYGGYSGFWDFGPLGVELFNNIKTNWWNFFVKSRENIVGIHASVISHPKTWEASGHVANFNDLFVKCKKCGKSFKIDEVEFGKVKCECGGEYENLGKFNLMFETKVGAIDSEKSYLRGETAQSMFMDFKLVAQTSRKALPFGIAQIGRCFRNEIAPRDFLFRSREFHIAEFEFFINPNDKKCEILTDVHKNVRVKLLDSKTQGNGKDDLTEMSIGEMLSSKKLGEWHAYWLSEQVLWFNSLGLYEIKVREHTKDELSHYSSATFDIDYEFTFGSLEVAGNANRGQYDLKQHEKFSGESMSIYDEKFKEKVVPRVIEPTFGMERVFLAILSKAYSYSKKRNSVVLKIPVNLASIKAAVFPIVKNPEYVEIAEEIVRDLNVEFNVVYDKSGSIGRRYARNDEIGTPYCITLDDKSIKGKDCTCTIRDRDTTLQRRVKVVELRGILRDLINGEVEFGSIGKSVETRKK